ncbi:MAG TPA: CvpA family protein [Cyclobacteriaceae bacterium]|nr:CvpA family protein [Cyclobacteriaceae bacterium]
MSKADLVIAIILAVGAFLGYKRGFLMELFFLVALVAGVLLGFRLMGWGVEVLAREFNADTKVLPYLSFLIIFGLVLLLVLFIGNRIKNSLDKTFLGRVDAVAGALLGILKYAFSISIIIWIFESFKLDWLDSLAKDSVLYPWIASVAPSVASFFGDFLPFFKETFKQF